MIPINEIKTGLKIENDEFHNKGIIHTIIGGDLVAVDLIASNVIWKTLKQISENYSIAEEEPEYFELDLDEITRCAYSGIVVYVGEKEKREGIITMLTVCKNSFLVEVNDCLRKLISPTIYGKK